MPMFDYFCGEHVYQELFMRGEKVPATIDCPTCGQRAEKQIATPAFTPGRWGDQTGKYGVNGFYDRGLGARYQTSMQREKIMDAKGLVPESSFGKHHVEDTLQKQASHQESQDKDIARYKANMKKHEGDKARAIAETFSVAEMKKNGTMAQDAAKEA
jgi:hypothetical protein